MVVIFGFGPGEAQDLGEVAAIVCPTCHNDVFLHHLRSKKTFRLYFVPIVPYGTDEYLLCPICHQGIQLGKPQLPAVEKMKARTKLFRRGQVPADFYRTQADGFWRQLGVRAGTGAPHPASPQVQPPFMPTPAPAPVAPARPPAAAVPAGPSLAERLADLAKLHADGVLTDVEFSAAKRRILEG